MLLRKLLIVPSLLVACVPLWAQSNLLTQDILQQQVSISSPALSPDGKMAAFITSIQDFDINGYDRRLILLDLETRRQQVLSVRAGLGQPTWAPDGEHLAFLASGDGSRQIFLLPMSGGEAIPITSSAGTIRRFSWNPDGQSIAFIADAVVAQPPGAEGFNRSFEVGSDDFLTTSPPVRKGVWITSRTGTETRHLTSPEVTVGTELSLSSLGWSSDGSQLTFTVFPTASPGDSDLGRIAIYDLGSDKMDWVTNHGMRESSSSFVPGSSAIAFQYPRDGVPSNLREVYLAGAETGGAQSRTRALDRHIGSFGFLEDGGLLLVGSDGLKTGVWHSSSPGEFNPVPMGDIVTLGAYEHSPAGSLLFVGGAIDRPDELYFKPTLEEEPVQLTNFNEAIAACTLGESEGFEWKSTDGFRPNGVITYPPDFDPEKKYPLVLLIHGGPTASSKLDFSSRAQLMAAKGWIVFQPNYRGSENLGNAFQSAIANDAAQGPGEDVISGVRELQKREYIDSERIAVSGWSYGGWMTAWLIGRYPDVWTAAVAGAAPVDFTDMYSLNDLNRMRRHAITESPYVDNNLDKAYAQSPITHFSKLQTPTLIMSVTGDYRVTITGSYKLYGALRDNNVPVQFIAYPGRGHFPGDPVQRQDVMTRWLSWLEKYLVP